MAPTFDSTSYLPASIGAGVKDAPSVKIFFSVDLVNATAFKRLHPAGWVSIFQSFFAQANSIMVSEWRSISEHVFNRLSHMLEPNFDIKTYSGNHPAVWKTLGDEIVFEKEMFSAFDILVAVRTFLSFLRSMDVQLIRISLPSTKGKSKTKSDSFDSLRVKGTSWLASFPNLNLSIDFDELLGKTPGLAGSLREYLGPSMDAGFRVKAYAASGRMVITIELAAALVMSIRKLGEAEPFEIYYAGGEELKGLFPDSSSYPRIFIRTQRPDLETPHNKLVYRGAVTDLNLLLQACNDLTHHKKYRGIFFKAEDILKIEK